MSGWVLVLWGAGVAVAGGVLAWKVIACRRAEQRAAELQLRLWYVEQVAAPRGAAPSLVSLAHDLPDPAWSPTVSPTAEEEP